MEVVLRTGQIHRKKTRPGQRRFRGSTVIIECAGNATTARVLHARTHAQSARCRVGGWDISSWLVMGCDLGCVLVGSRLHGCGLYILILLADHLAHPGSCEVRSSAWCAEDAARAFFHVGRWRDGAWVWYGMVVDTRDATRPRVLSAQALMHMPESTLRRGVGDGADPSAQRVALRCRS